MALTFLDFFASPEIPDGVTLCTFRKFRISAVHAINFFEFSRNPLDFRSRDIMGLLQRGDFLTVCHYVFSQRGAILEGVTLCSGRRKPLPKLFQ